MSEGFSLIFKTLCLSCTPNEESTDAAALLDLKLGSHITHIMRSQNSLVVLLMEILASIIREETIYVLFFLLSVFFPPEKQLN